MSPNCHYQWETSEVLEVTDQCFPLVNFSVIFVLRNRCCVVWFVAWCVTRCRTKLVRYHSWRLRHPPLQVYRATSFICKPAEQYAISARKINQITTQVQFYELCLQQLVVSWCRNLTKLNKRFFSYVFLTDIFVIEPLFSCCFLDFPDFNFRQWYARIFHLDRFD